MSKRVNYNFEYSFKAKASLIYNYLSKPYNLAVWFADDVIINDNKLVFSWDGVEESVSLDKKKRNTKVVYRWLDREDNETLTFVIETDEVTNGTILLISDYDNEDELEEAKMWWDGVITKLKRVIGG
ncbi:MAG: START-like domain-containing protein [Bacteroidota bacterium]|nr:START-like domain-containing protein [Bacteroidota bacterium]